MRRLLALLFVVALAATACTGGGTTDTVPATAAPTGTPAPAQVSTPVPDTQLKWWNDRVFYEIFVRSFKDSDGDGIGDFVGLTDSLDYLNDGDPETTDDLGITGIWLMPIFPSPSYHGYDVTDYRSVNPDYGTMEDFAAFLDSAHDRGIAVIIDLVINHSSRDHPWFTAAQAGSAQYRDWFIWSETNPGSTGPWGQQVWHEGDDGYYFGLFWEGMPDLNLENDDVTTELRDVARFWLQDVGVDGFRLDAARHLIEAGDVMSDTPATVEWLVGFNDHVHETAPDALVLGEVWSPTLNVASYVPDALDIAFEFALSEASGSAASTENAAALEAAVERVVGAYPDSQYAVFLTNHDMDRIMSVVDGNVALAKLAATWLLTVPGVPFLYYGEEVGLQGRKPDERIRTPMPWTGDTPGVGFTAGSPWEPADSGFAEHNVAAQGDDPGSLLSLYRALIHLRADSPALRRGSVIEVETGASTIFAYLRSDGDDHVLVIGNLGSNPTSDLALDLAEGPLVGMKGVTTVVGPGSIAPDVTDRGGFLDYRPVDSLPGHGVLVLRFTAEEQPAPTTTTMTAATHPQATMEDAAIAAAFVAAGEDWESFLATDFRLRIEDGSSFGLYDVVPEEAVEDWDGDGTSTIADLFVEQMAAERVFRTVTETTCVPSGTEVRCTIASGSLFDDLAGREAPPLISVLRVEGGLIVEFAPPAMTPAAEASQVAWNEQFLRFEEWVAADHSDRYSTVFSGGCCVGDATNLIFSPDTVEELRALLEEWAPPAAS